MAFLEIGDAGRIGRQTLAQESGLGEGSTRTILRRLTDEGYVRTSTGGAELTKKGKSLFSSVKKSLSELVRAGDTQLTLGDSHVAIAVRGGGGRVKYGIEQRDSAIKVGASGATTYIMSSGRFAIPNGSTDCEKDFPSKSWAVLRESLSPRSGDAVILCGASDETTAKLGALAAAATLL